MNKYKLMATPDNPDYIFWVRVSDKQIICRILKAELERALKDA